MTIEESDYYDSNNVRVVEFPNITSDLCGGTHIDFTKNLEAFKIVSIESKGTGIYRLRAITSHKLVNEFLKEEFVKYQTLLNNMYKKYVNLYDEKDTSMIKIKITLPSSEMNYEQQIQETKNTIELISEETKKLLKEQNKISKNIELKEVKLFDNIDAILISNINKNAFKDVAIQTREKNPTKLIIVLTEYENNKSSIIVTSKQYKVLDIVSQLQVKLNLKGGGNDLI